MEGLRVDGGVDLGVGGCFVVLGVGLGLCVADGVGAPSSGTSAHPTATAATTSATPARCTTGLTTSLLTHA
jgi:hypothetical protein